LTFATSALCLVARYPAQRSAVSISKKVETGVWAWLRTIYFRGKNVA
jgi:hypothetical protein